MIKKPDIVQNVQQFDTSRARAAADWLAGSLTAPFFAGTSDLAADIHENIENHVGWLTKEPSACKAVEYFAFDCFRAAQNNCPLQDPPLVSNGAAMLYLLLIAYERAEAPEATLLRLESAHEATLKSYLQSSSAQIDAFCGHLRHLRDFLGGLHLSNTRLVIVDMPIGNTLAACLLEQLLRPFCRVEVMRVALQRNTSRAQGPTRKQLLEEYLAKVKLAANDVVLYFDEWSTGANFNAMCEIHRKCIPRESFFLPAAVLTENSMKVDRYKSFCIDHDKLVHKWGRNGAEFRKVLPPVPSVSHTGEYFFWSEKDRMAGVRKLQVHGAMFSSIDATIEYLRANIDRLKVALGFQLADFVREGKLDEKYSNKIGVLLEIFNESYADYCECREQLRKCADDTTGGRELDDISEGIEVLSPKYGAVLDGRKAKMAVITAFLYSKRFGSLDPADRYFFETHAPVVVALNGRMAKVHEITLKFLNERLGLPE